MKKTWVYIYIRFAKPYKVETQFSNMMVWKFWNNNISITMIFFEILQVLSQNFSPWRFPEQCAVFQALSGVPSSRLQGPLGGVRGEVPIQGTWWEQNDRRSYGGDCGRLLQDHHYDVDSFVLQRIGVKWRRSITSYSISHIAVFCIHPLCLQPLCTSSPSLLVCVEKLHCLRMNCFFSLLCCRSGWFSKNHQLLLDIFCSDFSYQPSSQLRSGIRNLGEVGSEPTDHSVRDWAGNHCGEKNGSQQVQTPERLSY